MRYLVSAMLTVVAVINLLPLSGVLGTDRLHALYGVSFDEPNLAILMRHRAVLFGLHCRSSTSPGPSVPITRRSRVSSSPTSLLLFALSLARPPMYICRARDNPSLHQTRNTGLRLLTRARELKP